MRRRVVLVQREQRLEKMAHAMGLGTAPAAFLPPWPT